MLKSKRERLKKFKVYKGLIETKSKHNFNKFWSDNGGKFILEEFRHFLKERGIERQTSNPYRPQQNGVAERANHFIVEMKRNMLNV